MAHISFLWAVSLYSCLIQGSSAVTAVFVQKGKDVVLDVREADVPKSFIVFQWKFNINYVLATFSPDGKLEVSPLYTEKIESSVKKYSVTLKNPQETDSGVYTAQVIGNVKQEILAEYNITVQDPVSPVKLNADSDFSSDSCKVTVTCSTVDSHISSTFTCVGQTCYQEGGERSEVTNSGATLRVYLSNLMVICNHSNQVSWTGNMTQIQRFCPPHAESPQHHLYVIVIVTVAAIVAIVVAVVCYRKRRKSDSVNIENTVYTTPQSLTTQTVDQSPTDDASGLSPSSTYSLVGLPTRSMASTETRGNTLPDSLYAQVEKPARV